MFRRVGVVLVDFRNHFWIAGTLAKVCGGSLAGLAGLKASLVNVSKEAFGRKGTGRGLLLLAKSLHCVDEAVKMRPRSI